MKMAKNMNKIYMLRASQPTSLPRTNFVTRKHMKKRHADTISMPMTICKVDELSVTKVSSIIILTVHGRPRQINISKVFDPMALLMAIEARPKLVDNRYKNS